MVNPDLDEYLLNSTFITNVSFCASASGLMSPWVPAFVTSLSCLLGAEMFKSGLRCLLDGTIHPCTFDNEVVYVRLKVRVLVSERNTMTVKIVHSQIVVICRIS